MVNPKKVFSIHFPERKVYILSTYSEIEEKMEDIKKDKDHILYRYINPIIKEEVNDSEKELTNKYIKNSYKVLNFNQPKFNLFQSLYKWMLY